MIIEIKVILARALQFFEAMIHSTVARYLIKNFISPTEIPVWKWFSWTFIKNLDLKAILSLLGIASLTVLSFPLGVWVSSFDAGLSFPLTNLFNTAIGMVMIPLSMYSFNKTVGEVKFNNTVLLGLGLVEIASIIAVVGWYVIYTGNRV